MDEGEEIESANESAPLLRSTDQRNWIGQRNTDLRENSAEWEAIGASGALAPSASQVSLESDYDGDDLIGRFDDPSRKAPRSGSQGSLVTILSLWTTMMGSSLLVMPWAVAEAGLALGVVLIFVMGGLAFFPTTLIYKAAHYLESTLKVPVVEFQDICSRILGPKVAVVALLVSLLNLIGAMVVYWILMSTMLYQIGCFIYENKYPAPGNITDPSVIPDETGLFFKYWNEMLTVPFYLVFLVLPVICIKKPTFFTKLSSFGIVSIIFMVIFVITKIMTWGFHVKETNLDFKLVNIHFPSLTGTLSMGFFIHNCILGMTVHHSRPQYKARDTGIAFLMTAISYAIVGGGYYAAFPNSKDLIADNFLKNFSNREVLAFVARCLLLFQLYTVFPLLAYLFRMQLFYAIFGKVEVSYHFVVILNALCVGTCLIFAALYPRIGDILRILGSICGLVYVFTLPLLLDLVVSARTGRKSHLRNAVYVFLIGLGLANFIAQFIIPLHV
ncbi:Sodium-coupled neutral amino acid transporter 9-like protein [Hypsibius exemplaris]|uniref:Sodium-coupled neutral amino acid transporter 9-like protein n=1 Tax=Hypsibius exemplaris TaxID=2072580 RepID=A0A1W0WX12_HYPEX|nr:Sodium-coupled neutral amino acid transporter 9-like protein [Hypsibius exemplaris]